MLGLLIFVSIISLLSMVMNFICYLKIRKQLDEGVNHLADEILHYFIENTVKVEPKCSCSPEDK